MEFLINVYFTIWLLKGVAVLSLLIIIFCLYMIIDSIKEFIRKEKRGKRNSKK